MSLDFEPLSITEAFRREQLQHNRRAAVVCLVSVLVFVVIAYVVNN